jgi:hypothetical protein
MRRTFLLLRARLVSTSRSPQKRKKNAEKKPNTTTILIIAPAQVLRVPQP